MIKAIQSVDVQVSDQDKALVFYVEKLGFVKLADNPMGSDERWIEVAPVDGQTKLTLSKHRGGRMGGFLGYVLATDDIVATCAELKERGVSFTVDLHNEPWGRWAQIADPDGNEFGLWGALPEG